MNTVPPSQKATDIADEVELIDLHLDTLIPYRLWGYSPLKKQSFMPFGRHFFVHSDVPRMKEGGVVGCRIREGEKRV